MDPFICLAHLSARVRFAVHSALWIVLLAGGSACASFKVQKDAFVYIQSDLPLELGDERSTVGATNEWMPIYQLGDADAKILIKADNQILDTLVIRRTTHPYNQVRKGVAVGAGLTLAVLYSGYSDDWEKRRFIAQLSSLGGFAYAVDYFTDPYPDRLKPNQTLYYSLPNRKRARYEQIMAKARAADSASAERKPALELTTVDYMPAALRASFGLTSVPLSSASPPKEGAVPGPAATPATTAASPAKSNASPTASSAPEAGTPVPAGSTVPPPAVAAGNALVYLKNTGTLPIRVYLSVEKSFVVRAQATLPVEVPVGASLFLAKNTRPLELQTIGVAPLSNKPTLTLDLQHILSTWH
jgi:hypothetical protein